MFVQILAPSCHKFSTNNMKVLKLCIKENNVVDKDDFLQTAENKGGSILKLG